MEKIAEAGECRNCGFIPVVLYLHPSGNMVILCPVCGLYELIQETDDNVPCA